MSDPYDRRSKNEKCAALAVYAMAMIFIIYIIHGCFQIMNIPTPSTPLKENVNHVR